MKDEERKAKKEELKKKIDEMSDEELDKVAGGTDERGIPPELQAKIDKMLAQIQELQNNPEAVQKLISQLQQLVDSASNIEKSIFYS